MRRTAFFGICLGVMLVASGARVSTQVQPRDRPETLSTEGSRRQADPSDEATPPRKAQPRPPAAPPQQQAARHQLEVRKDGYRTFRTEVDVTGGTRVRLEIRLER